MKLSKIVPKDGKRFQFEYEYDFGDGWEHEILFEGFGPPRREPVIRCVWRENGPARLMMSAAPTATKNT